MNPEGSRPRSQVRPRTVLVISATVLAVVAAVWFAVQTQLAIVLTITGALLAMALDRPVQLLHERLRAPRGVAIAIVFVVAIGIVVAIGFVIVPTAVAQAQALVREWPQLLDQVQESPLYRRVDDALNLGARLEQLQQRASEYLTGAASELLSAVGAIFAAGIAVTTALFVTLFMLIWGPGLTRAFLAEVRPDHRPTWESLLGRIHGRVGGYIAGLIVLAGVNATLATIFLAIVGVPFFLPLGLLSGLGSLVPLVGATLAGAVIAVVAAATGGIWIGVAAVVYTVIYQQVENHVFAPVIYRRTTDLNPLVTLLAVVYFAELSGLIGALLAVPLVAIAQILLLHYLELRRERLGLPPRSAEEERT